MGGACEIAFRFAALRERPRRLARSVPQPRALVFQPALELGRIREEESFEQTAPIEFQRAAPVTRLEGMLERANVAPQPLLADAHLLIASARDHFAGQRLGKGGAS